MRQTLWDHHVYSLNTWEADAGRLRVQGQLGLRSKAPVSRKKEKKNLARCWWFMPIILATQEAEIRIVV
jgi:hypothetical protein